MAYDDESHSIPFNRRPENAMSLVIYHEKHSFSYEIREGVALEKGLIILVVELAWRRFIFF